MTIATVLITGVPSTGYAAADAILIVCAVLVALAGLWVKVLRPISRAVTQVDEYGPVLRDIAKQFKSDSGSTLKDDFNSMKALIADQAAVLVRLEGEVKRMDRLLRTLPARVAVQIAAPDTLADESTLMGDAIE